MVSTQLVLIGIDIPIFLTFPIRSVLGLVHIDIPILASLIFGLVRIAILSSPSMIVGLIDIHTFTFTLSIIRVSPDDV